MMKWLYSSIRLLFCMMMLIILGLLVFGFEGIEFACKRTFLLQQWKMLLLGGAVLAAACLLFKRLESRKGLQRAEKMARYAIWLILFGVQIVLSYFSYFLTGWDAGMMLEYAHWIGVFGYEEVNNLYYSMYPNNVLLTMIFAWIMRLFSWIVGGEPGVDRCAFVLIAVQCLLSSMTGALCQDVVRRATRSNSLSWMAAVVYIAFVGLSPWRMIPYSDSMALIVPMSVLWLYQSRERFSYWAWAGIGMLTGVGYLLKPQAVIVTIALVIVELAKLVGQKRVRDLIGRLGVLVITLLLVVGPGFQAVVRASGFTIDPQKKTGLLHYVMMGLNGETNGGFFAGDERITMSAETKEERSALQIREIKSRLERMGLQGWMKHLQKKMMTNYADGTFGWGVEGQFYNQLIKDKDARISPVLKSIIYPDENGKMPGFVTVCQCFWLALLFGALLQGMFFRGGQTEEAQAIMAAMLAVIGLTLFELIFEARARYLYIYAPFYVMLGVIGLGHTLEWLIAEWKK